MSKKHYPKPSVAPSHPGGILKTGFIEQHGLRVETVAGLLGIARGHLSRVINAHAPVTPDIAMRLEALTQTPASQWLALQSKYDAYLMDQDAKFKEYKRVLTRWAASALPLQPAQRRENKATQDLVCHASELAKKIGKPEKIAH